MFHLPFFGRSTDGHPQRPPQPYSGNTLNKHSRLRNATLTHSVCPYCAVGCATNIYTKQGEVIDIEGNPQSPINEGCLCPKGANIFQLSVNAHREKRVMYRAPHSDHWEYKSLDWAMDRIAQRVKETREAGFRKKTADGLKLNSVINMGTLGGAALDNEENYLIKKLFCGGLGIVSIENQARICHSASVPGLGAAFGRGAATTYQQDLANSDCIIFMGSDMAEAHPVGFRWAMKAKEHGAKLIHVDPRFTRTSAKCDMHVTLRAGTDIAFLGGIINYILTHDKWFKEYVHAYTNASTLIEEGFKDTEDLNGLFSGWNAEQGHYDKSKGHWGYEKPEETKKQDGDQQGSGGKGQKSQPGGHGIHGYASMGGASTHTTPRGKATEEPGGQPPRDETLQHPRCVMQLLRKHYARYTPQLVSEICGCAPEQLITVAETLCQNSGRERTSAFVYEVGWTQHSTGVQMIYAASVIQLLLGNVGRPGAGVMAMRGHCSIQGSTDIPTLYDMLPSYLAQPMAEEHHETLDGYVEYESFPTGWWAHYRKFIVSLLKAWYGDAATAENSFHFDWVPRIDDDYSQLPFFNRMSQGKVNGYMIFGQNPAGGGPNANLHRAGLRELDWLVVMDWFATETATFWKNDPKGPPPEDVKTEVFFMPAAPITAKEGSFTNTQRLVQWHDKAVDPEGDCRSDLWFFFNLGKRMKQLYA
ncbi:MAG TPA: molybdopterin-dependent oxidoreductase, partial [Acidobacteriaceae bacterium]|nr:molybdopterin-dependent oxidoreductase [Acidobacteriaceae bacterium]